MSPAPRIKVVQEELPFYGQASGIESGALVECNSRASRIARKLEFRLTSGTVLAQQKMQQSLFDTVVAKGSRTTGLLHYVTAKRSGCLNRIRQV